MNSLTVHTVPRVTTNPNDVSTPPHDHLKGQQMNIEVTKEESTRLILAGYTAIANRTLGVIARPQPLSPADQAELDQFHALLDNYDELMSPYVLPPDTPAAHQAGSKPGNPA